MNFYGWLANELESSDCCEPVLPGKDGMPDPLRARKQFWLPYIVEQMKADEQSVVIGHSSGALAALRLAENTKLGGIVVIAAYDDHMGDENEKASGYFDGKFDWERIRENCGFVIQIAGAKDDLVPIEIQRRVSRNLGLEPHLDYIELPDRDHFFSPPFPELTSVLFHRIQEANNNLTKGRS